MRERSGVLAASDVTLELAPLWLAWRPPLTAHDPNDTVSANRPAMASDADKPMLACCSLLARDCPPDAELLAAEPFIWTPANCRASRGSEKPVLVGGQLGEVAASVAVAGRRLAAGGESWRLMPASAPRLCGTGGTSEKLKPGARPGDASWV